MIAAALFGKEPNSTASTTLISAKNHPEMPCRVRKVLEKVGNEPILKIQLGRTPVQELPLKILDFLSDSKFSDKKLELGYDELYHNYLLITIKSNIRPHVLQHIIEGVEQNSEARIILKLEKAQRIALKYPEIPTELIDVYDIPLTPNKPLTLNQLISTASNVDKNFYRYDVGDNNMCQTFVENIIEINGLLPNIVDQATLDALKPIDTRTLISTLGSRANLVKAAVDLGAKLDMLAFDHKIKWKKRNPKEYSRLEDKNQTELENADVSYDTILQLKATVSHLSSREPSLESALRGLTSSTY